MQMQVVDSSVNDQWRDVRDEQLNDNFFDVDNVGDIRIRTAKNQEPFRIEVKALGKGQYRVIKTLDKWAESLKLNGKTVHISFPDAYVELDGKIFARVRNVKKYVLVRGIEGGIIKSNSAQLAQLPKMNQAMRSLSVSTGLLEGMKANFDGYVNYMRRLLPREYPASALRAYYRLFMAIDVFLKAINNNEVHYIYPKPGLDVMPNLFGPTDRVNDDMMSPISDFREGAGVFKTVLEDIPGIDLSGLEKTEGALEGRMDAHILDNYEAALRASPKGQRVIILKGFDRQNRGHEGDPVVLLRGLLAKLSKGDKVLFLSLDDIRSFSGTVEKSGFEPIFQSIPIENALKMRGEFPHILFGNRGITVPSIITLFEKTDDAQLAPDQATMAPSIITDPLFAQGSKGVSATFVSGPLGDSRAFEVALKPRPSADPLTYPYEIYSDGKMIGVLYASVDGKFKKITVDLIKIYPEYRYEEYATAALALLRERMLKDGYKNYGLRSNFLLKDLFEEKASFENVFGAHVDRKNDHGFVQLTFSIKDRENAASHWQDQEIVDRVSIMTRRVSHSPFFDFLTTFNAITLGLSTLDIFYHDPQVTRQASRILNFLQNENGFIAIWAQLNHFSGLSKKNEADINRAREAIAQFKDVLKLLYQQRSAVESLVYDNGLPIKLWIENDPVIREDHELVDAVIKLPENMNLMIEKIEEDMKIISGEKPKADIVLNDVIDMIESTMAMPNYFPKKMKIKEIVYLIDPKDVPRLEIENKLPDTSVSVLADLLPLASAIYNVTNNGRDYATRYRLMTGVDVKVTLTLKEVDGRLHIEIYNDGELIPEDKLEKIFELSETGREGGSGLGLFETKKTLNDYGGDITVRNEKRGVLFTITLPLAKKAARVNQKAMADQGDEQLCGDEPR